MGQVKSGFRWAVAGVAAVGILWVAGAGIRVGQAASPEVERWGNLTVSPLVISPPFEYIPRDASPITPARWFFPVTSIQDLQELFAGVGMASDDAARLVAGAKADQGHGGLLVFPDRDLIRTMEPGLRSRLYLLLATNPLNFAQQSAYRFYAKSIDEWLGPDITPRVRDLVDPLIYREGGFLFLADLESVREDIGEGPEMQRLLKRLLRQATVLVSLRIDDPSQVNGLVEYWGRGGRKTDIRPLLESVAESAPQHSIDIVHLLPEFARRLLYRYPRVSLEDFEKPQLANCYWTALNFFAETPDDSVLDTAVALRRLHTDYYIVQDQLQLGDVVAFSDGDIENIFHVAVYIADDLVFTKNGYFSLAPWTIIPIDRLKGHFAEHPGTWRVTYYRRKDL
jgi:hypothetical protein